MTRYESAKSVLTKALGKSYRYGMEIAEIIGEVRKLLDDGLLALAAQVDEEAACAVDHRFESLVREGRFEDSSAEALREEEEGKTVSLHEVIDQRGIW